MPARTLSLQFDAYASLVYSGCAGWSSLVARRAHNPKVVSSNLTPATMGAYEENPLSALLIYGYESSRNNFFAQFSAAKLFPFSMLSAHPMSAFRQSGCLKTNLSRAAQEKFPAAATYA